MYVGVTYDNAFHVLRYDLNTFVTFVLFLIILPPHITFIITKDPLNLFSKYHQRAAVELRWKFVSVLRKD